jgi:beta-1,4-mannosyltransferase
VTSAEPGSVTDEAGFRKVALIPDWRGGNPYLGLLAGSLERSGWTVRLRNFPSDRFPLNRTIGRVRRIDVIHLHWVNGLIGPVLWSGSAARREVKLALLAADILLARSRGVRIVWTVHNLVTHESSDPALEQRVRGVIARAVSGVIVHSAAAVPVLERAYGVPIAHKARVIPHGNYDGQYAGSPQRAAALRDGFGLDGSETVLLCFGIIRRYKGVAAFIEQFSAVRDSRLRLIVAGHCREQALADELGAVAARDPRVLLRLGNVEDADVAPLFSLAHLVILPFEQTLTSGSAVLAMTLGRALLLSGHARVLGMPDSGVAYYDAPSQLAPLLAELDRERLLEMGRANRATAAERDWAGVSALTSEAYGAPRRRGGHVAPAVGRWWQGTGKRGA